MSEKDLIIGAITGYDWDKIKYWVNSILLSGFTGDKVVVAFDCHSSTINKLNEAGFKTLVFNRDSNGNFYYPSQIPWAIVVERFFYYWQYVNSLPDNYYRYIITTDVKDVIFQSNPSIWLENNIDTYEIVASCESLLYKDEPWGADNLKGSFPFIYDNLKSKPIWNCGVQAGKQQTLKDLWLNIYLTCKAGARANPDQAAYNMLLNTRAYNKLTKFTMSESGWACQAGTTVDPKKIADFRANLLEPEPVWHSGFSHTSAGLVHTIVHQWDRIPEWLNDIERRYGI